MITKFNEFINEGRGISDVVKAYTSHLYELYVENNGKNELCYLYLNPLPLYDFIIKYEYADYYGGEFNPKFSFFNDKDELCNVMVTISINKNDEVPHMIKGIISHELTHVKEFYDIMLNLHKHKIEIKPSHVKIIDLINKFTDKDSKYYIFLYTLYLSLDNEMNARIAQVYDYLLEFNSVDADFLFEQLKKHKNWELLNIMGNFDYKEFVDENIKNVELSGLLKISKEIQFDLKDKLINHNTKIIKFIDMELNDLSDLYKFYEKWGIYFKERQLKHIEKYKYFIKEVIEDLNNNRPFNENHRSYKRLMDLGMGRF